MTLKLQEKGRYGHPESDLFGKCKICGRAIDKHQTYCLKCKNIRFFKRRVEPEPPSFWPIVILLFLALTVGGLYFIPRLIAYWHAEKSDTQAPFLAATNQLHGQNISQPPAAALQQAPPRSSRSNLQSQNVPSKQAASSDLKPVSSDSATDSLRSDSRPQSTPRMTTQRVECPVCRGRGRLTYKQPHKGSYVCPVCAGKGYRKRRFLTAKWRLCDNCKGMGAVAEEDDFFRKRNRIAKKRCAKCNGRGLLPLAQ